MSAMGARDMRLGLPAYCCRSGLEQERRLLKPFLARLVVWHVWSRDGAWKQLRTLTSNVPSRGCIANEVAAAAGTWWRLFGRVGAGSFLAS
jgi:hypothetical protein